MTSSIDFDDSFKNRSMDDFFDSNNPFSSTAQKNPLDDSVETKSTASATMAGSNHSDDFIASGINSNSGGGGSSWDAKPSSQADRRAARRALKASGSPTGMPRKWSSAGALGSRTRNQVSDTITEEDGSSGSSNHQWLSGSEHGGGEAFDPFGTSKPQRSSSGSRRPTRVNSIDVIPRSPGSIGRMKLVPTKMAAPFPTGGVFESPASIARKSQAEEIMRMPDAPSLNNMSPMTPTLRMTQTLRHKRRSSVETMHSKTNILQLDPFDHKVRTPENFRQTKGIGLNDSASSFINNNMRDALEIDPFNDSQSLGDVEDFTERDDEDDELFLSGGNWSSQSSKMSRSSSNIDGSASSSIWDKAIKSNTAAADDHKKMALNYGLLKSEIEDMRKSVHEQEKEMERQIHARDDLIQKLARQLEEAQGGGGADSDNDTKASRKSSSSKGKKSMSNSDHYRRSKKDSDKRLSRSDHLRSRPNRRGSTGGVSSPRVEKAKRRGSTSAVGEKKERMRRRGSASGMSEANDKARRRKEKGDDDDGESRTSKSSRKLSRRSSMGTSKSERSKRRTSSSPGAVDKKDKRSSKSRSESKRERQKEKVHDAALTLLMGESPKKEKSLERKVSKSSRSNKDRGLSKSSSHSRKSSKGLDISSTHSRKSEKKRRSKKKIEELE